MGLLKKININLGYTNRSIFSKPKEANFYCTFFRARHKSLLQRLHYVNNFQINFNFIINKSSKISKYESNK